MNDTLNWGGRSLQTQFFLANFVIIKKFKHSLQSQGLDECRTPLTPGISIFLELKFLFPNEDFNITRLKAPSRVLLPSALVVMLVFLFHPLTLTSQPLVHHFIP